MWEEVVVLGELRNLFALTPVDLRRRIAWVA
jgi:hypothetical protein